MEKSDILDIKPGILINKRFKVVRTLGKGAMGTVYLCVDTVLENRPVAMKVLFPEVARDESMASRFRKEAIATYNIVHKNVVRTYEYVEEGDFRALAMEYIEGEDLADLMRRVQPLPIKAITAMLSQTCDGLQSIHEAGVVHRDLKPPNVILSKSGDIKIADFGVARLQTHDHTISGASVVGTIYYMSPEYLADGKVHPAGDVYSLGVIAYEMITGTIPHKSDSLREIISARTERLPEPPLALRNDCPLELSRVVMKALQNDYTQRYHSAEEFGNDLKSLGEDKKSDPEDFKPHKTAEISAIHPKSLLPLDNIPGENPTHHLSRTEQSSSPFWGYMILLFLLTLILITSAILLKYGKINMPNKKLEATPPVMATDHLLIRDSLKKPIDFLQDKDVKRRKRHVPALVKASKLCDLNQCQELISQGSNVNEKDFDGVSVLSWAVRRNCMKVAKYLIQQGADVNSKAGNDFTPYRWAKMYKHKQIQKLLLNSGAKKE